MPDIAMLRQRAAQARRLAWATTDDRLQEALEKLVNDLEEAADTAEMASWASGRTSPPWTAFAIAARRPLKNSRVS